ncbi:stabilin-2 [Brachionichthys hirsutus]|uniref:stabilin-2 n=1 Tax=Brachionichthys hirsutus TaxID=412623 RepID=UPI0036046C20
MENLHLLVMVMMMMMMMMMKRSSAASEQNLCLNSTVLRTRVACHSCTISMLIPCPSGYKQTPRSSTQDCKYTVRTPSMALRISGCSFQCHKEAALRTCCPGYWGPDCMECPESARGPCSNRGVCSDGLGGNGTCSCQVGFAGTSCEDCGPGRYGPSCDSVCSCVHGLCDSGLKGSGSCLCFSGYAGPQCDRELPECAALGCRQNSRCAEESLTGRLLCQCLPGYQTAGAQCLPVNPCLQQVCHPQASCVHTGPNRHICSCNHGYSGDGQVCMPVDPCQTHQGGCAAASTRCVYDGPGESHCECLPGFEHLTNGGCHLKDLCRPDSCNENAVCTTTRTAQLKCTCLQGYIGNGQVCHGNIIQKLNDLNTEPGGRWVGQLGSAITLFSSISWELQNLGPFTIFVPINKGFRGTALGTLKSDISKTKYLCNVHLVAGLMTFDKLNAGNYFHTLTGHSAETESSMGDKRLRLHGSKKKSLIIDSDVVASNGMIHIVNRLIDNISPLVESNNKETFLTLISDNFKFDKFKSLLEKADLASVLDLPGPMTVFAPVSSTFGAITEEHLQYLSSAEGHSKLVELLRNHIVQSTALDVYNAASSPMLATMANQVLTINVTDSGQFLVDGKPVLETAVEARNGRLYILDGVLTPPSIQPILPHRCDTNKTKTYKAECVSCSKAKQHQCSPGVYTGSSVPGCVYDMFIPKSSIRIPVQGCSPLCAANVTTPACCSGFYGPDCGPCPGGHQAPCSGHGQCFEGIGGNGSCACDVNFRGSRCQFCSSANKYGPSCDRTCPCIHGRCDNRPDSDGRCKPDSCLSGFTGWFCDRATVVCGAQARFCHAHADCDFSQGTPRCVCKAGYQGDGITCVESDPCAPPHRGGCSLNAKCVKTGPATHTCQCLSSWREDGDACQPINNCIGPGRGGCHANGACIYVGPGQSDCSCKSGYKGDGRDCEAVNQCVTASGGCHYLASCRLLSTGWTCLCDEGFHGNGQTCYGSVQLELLGLSDASDFSTWVTDSGLSWSLLDQNITLLVPPSAAVARLSPEDRRFWTMKGNLPSLIRNHIVPGIYPLERLSNTSSLTSLLKTSLPVSTTNELVVVGGAAVTTPNLAATNGLIHVIDEVLVPERKLSEGLLAVLALRPEFSLFRASLVGYNLTDEIDQEAGFTVFAPTDAAISDYLQKTSATRLDVNTTRYHVVPAERLLKTDLQHGGYKQTLLGFSFQLGIFPRDGKLFVNDAQINTSNILSSKGVIHGLTAVLPVSRNRCDDVTHRRVPGLCVDCLFPKNKICPNDSVPDVTAWSRKCMLTWMSEEGRGMSLGCRATCVQETVVRRCCGGFFGEHCEPCPGSEGRPCFANGLCLDGINGTGTCRCRRGFNGTACETCQSGRYGVHCDQECSCKNGRCNEGPPGDGACECDAGWRGVQCEERLPSSGDELCGSLTCHTSSNCVIGLDGPRCLCAAGFQGNGTSCQAVDACASDNGGCSLDAVCKRTRPGRRDCVCNRGYSGDGLVCVEINPCVEGNGGCHDNAACVHVGPNKTTCACRDGFHGDGQTCTVVNLCLKRNGGCHDYARCNTTAPGVRTCTCYKDHIGDGLTCKGTLGKEIARRKLRDFYLLLRLVGVSLKGRGPFTVFAPSGDAFAADKVKITFRASDQEKERLGSVLRNHIVMCHTLRPADLGRAQNLTSLSGLVLTTGSSQGRVFVNRANVAFSDDVSTNGILHEIDKVLLPADPEDETPPVPRNLTGVAQRHGYRTFYKLLEDTGVMSLLEDKVNQPVTVFLPSDGVMASLSQEHKDYLFHPDNQPQLLETLKYHVLQSHKVYAEGLIHLDSARTLQGSPLSFSCGGADNMGDVFISDRKCRIVQRHLAFTGGLAYGIDCLLTPPSLGGRCDHQMTFDIQMGCELCIMSRTHCPPGSTTKEVQKCDLPTRFVTRNAGCRSTCTINSWQPKCCHGYYGRDCLVCPGSVDSPCRNHGKCDDGHLGNGTCTCDAGFGGVACERCAEGFFGPSCEACSCSEHGSCDGGRRGTGSCFCEPGWTGQRCETQQAETFRCSPSCSPKAVCRDNNTCVCRPFHVGDGFTCTVADMCQIWNGGCAKGAKCSQEGQQVRCTCPKGHSGDGFTCQPIDPCVSGENGGCHEHASCTMTAPGTRTCTCRDGYVGDGLTCEIKELPISRCLQGNGGCHQDAKCSDLHFEDAKLGVFHHRSDLGQYRLNYSQAQQACTARGGCLATYTQLSYAQQGGMNLCAAGWLDRARVGYPTSFSSPLCGFGHVGIVDYGIRKNLSETWDTFCYRMKEVECACHPGYLGDGFSCTGNLLQVLESTPTFSNFLTQIRNYSQVSASGRRFVERLGNLAVQSTLFVPDNNGLAGNQTLSQQDIEFHLLGGQVLLLSPLKNGTRVRTRAGSLMVSGVPDLLDPSVLASRYVNDRFVTQPDLPASNGIIHVLHGPLKAPPPRHEMHVAHKAGMGVGVVLLIVLAGGAVFVGYHFYTHKAKPFQFHYFKEDEGEEDVPPPRSSRSISNPVYEAAPEPSGSGAPVSLQDS